jgi:hypothetical protein
VEKAIMKLRTLCAACAILTAIPSIAGAVAVSIDITITGPSAMTATGSFNLDSGCFWWRICPSVLSW